MTMAIAFSAASFDGRDGAAAKIAQLNDLHQDLRALLFQAADGIWHVASYPNVYIRSDYTAKKRKPPDPQMYVAHPAESF